MWKKFEFWQKTGLIIAVGIMSFFLLYLFFDEEENKLSNNQIQKQRYQSRHLSGMYEIKEGEITKDHDIYGKVVRARKGEKFVVWIESGKLDAGILYYNNSPLDPVPLNTKKTDLRVVSAPLEGDMFRLIKTKPEGRYLVRVQVSK